MWSRSVINNILSNPIYIGKMAYGRRTKEKIKGTKNSYRRVATKNFILSDGEHKAIIDDKTWEITQQKKKKNRRNFNSIVGKDRVHLLSGILKCPKCGGPMYASKYCKTNKRGLYREWYYECSYHKSTRGHPCDCKLKIKKPKIEPYVVELIKRIISDSRFVEYVEDYIGKKTNTSELENEKKSYAQELRIANENKSSIEKD